MKNNKVQITQQEINDIYEITKEEPFPKVTEVKEEEEKDLPESFLNEEQQEQDNQYLRDYPIPKEEEDGN